MYIAIYTNKQNKNKQNIKIQQKSISNKQIQYNDNNDNLSIVSSHTQIEYSNKTTNNKMNMFVNILIVIIKVIIILQIVCGNRIMIKSVNCINEQQMSSYQAGVVNKINQKIYGIKQQILQQITKEFYKLKQQLKNDQRQILMKQTNIMIKAQRQIIERQIEHKIMMKMDEEIFRWKKGIQEQKQKVSELLKVINEVKEQIKREQYKSNQQKKMIIGNVVLIQKKIDKIKKSIEQNQTGLQNEIKSIIKDVDTKIQEHQTGLQNQLNKRENAMNTLRESIIKDLETKIQANTIGLNEKDAKFEKNINELKETLHHHINLINYNITKTSQNLINQISHNSNILQKHSSYLSKHNNTLFQHQILYSALSHYFQIENAKQFSKSSSFSASTQNSNSPHKLQSGKKQKNSNQTVYFRNISTLQNQFNKLDHILLTLLDDYDKSPCKTTNLSFYRMYCQSPPHQFIQQNPSINKQSFAKYLLVPFTFIAQASHNLYLKIRGLFVSDQPTKISNYKQQNGMNIQNQNNLANNVVRFKQDNQKQNTAETINDQQKQNKVEQMQKPKVTQPFIHQDQYVLQILKRREKQKQKYENKINEPSKNKEQYKKVQQTQKSRFQPQKRQNIEIAQYTKKNANYERLQDNKLQKLKIMIRWFIFSVVLVTICSFAVEYIINMIYKQKPVFDFKINESCRGMKYYRIRPSDKKIIYQPKYEDLKKKARNHYPLLHLQPSIRQMCNVLKQTRCSFTFMITQSINLNIAIGVTDKADINKSGLGAIYYHGKNGKVYQNGSEIGCHFVSSFEEVKARRDHERHHKVAYFNINNQNQGFKVKDIVSAEVDILEGQIHWMINGRIVAMYYSDYIKYIELVPFISMVDLYDGAYYLGV